VECSILDPNFNINSNDDQIKALGGQIRRRGSSLAPVVEPVGADRRAGRHASELGADAAGFFENLGDELPPLS